MKKRYINATLFMLMAIVTAFAGLYIGQHFLQKEHIHQNSQSANWHQVLHNKINITPQQNATLKNIETRYRQQRKYQEEQMRLANMELAESIKIDKSFSPSVQAATDKIHHAMGEIQKITLEHLFEMSTILTDKQNLKLEQMITDALYQNK